jgi:hypothetical protein
MWPLSFEEWLNKVSLSTKECNNCFQSSFFDFDRRLPPSFTDDLRRPLGVVSRSWLEEESRSWLEDDLRRPVGVVSRSWLEEDSTPMGDWPWLEPEDWMFDFGEICLLCELEDLLPDLLGKRILSAEWADPLYSLDDNDGLWSSLEGDLSFPSSFFFSREIFSDANRLWLEEVLRRPVRVVSRSWLEEESRAWLEDDLRRPVGVVSRSWLEEDSRPMDDRSWLEPSACPSGFGELCLLCELEDLLPDLPGELILSAEWADPLYSFDDNDGLWSSLKGDLSFPLPFFFFSEIFSVLIPWSDELLWYFFGDGEASLSVRANFPLCFSSFSRCISSCFDSFSSMLSADDREVWSIEDLRFDLSSFLLPVLDSEGWLLDLWYPIEDDPDIIDAESKDASTCFFRFSFSVRWQYWFREIWSIENPRFDLPSFFPPVLDSEGWLLDLWNRFEDDPDITGAKSKDASNIFFRFRSSAECSATLSRKCDETLILSSNLSSCDPSDNLPLDSIIGCCSSLFSFNCPFRPFEFLLLGKAGSRWLDIFISSLDFFCGFPSCFASFSCRSRWMRSLTCVLEITGFGLELVEILLRKSSSSCIRSFNEDEKAKEEEEKSCSMLFAATLSWLPKEACTMKCWGGIEVKIRGYWSERGVLQWYLPKLRWDGKMNTSYVVLVVPVSGYAVEMDWNVVPVIRLCTSTVFSVPGTVRATYV